MSTNRASGQRYHRSADQARVVGDLTIMIETASKGAPQDRDSSSIHIVLRVLIIYALVASYGVWTAVV